MKSLWTESEICGGCKVNIEEPKRSTTKRLTRKKRIALECSLFFTSAFCLFLAVVVQESECSSIRSRSSSLLTMCLVHRIQPSNHSSLGYNDDTFFSCRICEVKLAGRVGVLEWHSFFRSLRHCRGGGGGEDVRRGRTRNCAAGDNAALRLCVWTMENGGTVVGASCYPLCLGTNNECKNVGRNGVQVSGYGSCCSSTLYPTDPLYRSPYPCMTSVAHLRRRFSECWVFMATSCSLVTVTVTWGFEVDLSFWPYVSTESWTLVTWMWCKIFGMQFTPSIVLSALAILT